MARWKQVFDEKQDKYVLVPIDEAAVKRDASHGIIVRGNFDTFVSPVDGSVIRNHREYQEHCRRNNVIPTQELGSDYMKGKADERERFYTGRHTREEEFKRKQEIHEIINRHTRH